MITTTVDRNTNKQQLLDDLKDSLIELNKKQKGNIPPEHSWRDLFSDEE